VFFQYFINCLYSLRFFASSCTTTLHQSRQCTTMSKEKSGSGRPIDCTKTGNQFRQHSDNRHIAASSIDINLLTIIHRHLEFLSHRLIMMMSYDLRQKYPVPAIFCLSHTDKLNLYRDCMSNRTFYFDENAHRCTVFVSLISR